MEADDVPTSGEHEPTVNLKDNVEDPVLAATGADQAVEPESMLLSTESTVEDAADDVAICEQIDAGPAIDTELKDVPSDASPSLEKLPQAGESVGINIKEEILDATDSASIEEPSSSSSIVETGKADAETIHAQEHKEDNICKECDVLATLKRFRRGGGRIRKGQQVHWICRHKCPNCEAFFGDEWELDPELQQYKKRSTVTDVTNAEVLSSTLASNGISSSCNTVEGEAIDDPLHAPPESQADMNGASPNPTTGDVMDASHFSLSEKQPTIARGGRRRQTMRKNTRRSAPVKEECPEETIDKPSVSSEEIMREIDLDTGVVYGVSSSYSREVERKRPGRPKKRGPEPEIRLRGQPPPKIFLPPPEKRGPSEEEIRKIIADKSQAIADAVLAKLEIEPPCSEEASTSTDSIEAYKDRALSRSIKTFGIMKYTIDRLRSENMQLTSTLKDVKHKFAEHARATRLQGSGIIALVDSLNKEFKFFKNECISEARATNELFKKQQAEFEVKYGYRVMERDIVQGHFDNLQTRFNNAKLQMREMADDIARQENEIREFEKPRDTAETGKYMRCQTCEANEELLEKLRPELTKLRKEKGEWDKKLKQAEKESEAVKERLKVVENELKKQTFIARSYEALDKQMRAKEQEARLAAAKSAAKPTEEERTADEVKKEPKEKEPTLPSFSDIVDPEILAHANKMGNSQPPMFKVPNREAANGTGSVAITPESPRFEPAYQNHSRAPPEQSPRPNRPNPQRPPHTSLTAKYAAQPSRSRPPEHKPVFLCHQRDAHIPRPNYPPFPNQPSPWQRPPPQALRPQEPSRPPNPLERRMDWSAYLSQKRKNP